MRHTARLIFILCLTTLPGWGQQIIGKHPADQIIPSFWNQNNNASNAVVGLNHAPNPITNVDWSANPNPGGGNLTAATNNDMVLSNNLVQLNIDGTNASFVYAATLVSAQGRTTAVNYTNTGNAFYGLFNAVGGNVLTNNGTQAITTTANITSQSGTVSGAIGSFGTLNATTGNLGTANVTGTLTANAIGGNALDQTTNIINAQLASAGVVTNSVVINSNLIYSTSHVFVTGSDVSAVNGEYTLYWTNAANGQYVVTNTASSMFIYMGDPGANIPLNYGAIETVSNSVAPEYFLSENGGILDSINWSTGLGVASLPITVTGFTNVAYYTNYIPGNSTIVANYFTTNICYVNPLTGSDVFGSRNGFPFQTFAAAQSAAFTNDTIAFEPGFYSVTDFNVTKKVNVIGLGKVVLTNTGPSFTTVLVADGCSMQNIEFTFRNVVSVVGSFQTLRNVKTIGLEDGLTLGGGTNCLIDSCWFECLNWDSGLVYVANGSQIKNTTFKARYNPNSSSVARGLVVATSGGFVTTNLLITGCNFDVSGGPTNMCITVSDGSKVTLSGCNMIHTGTNLTFGAYSYDSSSKILGQWVDNGTNTSTTYTGNGYALTNLNASALTSGTVPDARLSTNVPLIRSGTLAIPITNSAVQLGDGSTAAKIYMDSTRAPTTPIMVLQPTNDQSAMVLDLMPRDSSGTNPANVTNNLATGTVWIHLVNKDLTVEPNNWGAMGLIMSGNNGFVKMMKGGTNVQGSFTLDAAGASFLSGGSSKSAYNSSAWYFGTANQFSIAFANGNLTGTAATFSGTVTATGGIATTITNTATIGLTGWTNNLGVQAVIDNCTGTSVNKFNNKGTNICNYGTLTTPITIILQPGGSITGTSLAGSISGF